MRNSYESSPTITNCSFTNNEADYGGGIENYSSSPTLTNCTIADNRAERGGALHNDDNSSPKLRNTIIFGNSNGIYSNNNSAPVITYSLVQGITSTDNGNISGDTNPLFVDPANLDYRLQPCSPVINKGNNSYYNSGQTPDLSAITTDLAGDPRFAHNNTVDMGTFEIANGIFYVKAGATGNGAHWECPIGDLQAAIDAAASGQQVWVAGGTYQPGSGQSFRMKEGVKVYGGFAGEELTLSARNLKLTANASSLEGNGAQVVINSGLTSAALLDGFTITGGEANDGGGMYNNNSSPTIINCSFTNNEAFVGGGIYNNYSSPTIINCSFVHNTAVAGGGICNDKRSSPTLTNCSFTNNEADYGGGMRNSFESSPTLTNCTIADNRAEHGGALHNESYSSPILRNTIIFGNSNGINNSSSAPVITYSLVQGITSTDNNNISGDTDPIFVDPANGDFRLQPCSQVINKGNNSYYESGQTPNLSAITTDLAGEPRFYDNGTVDMGTYEFAGIATPALAVHNHEAVVVISGDYSIMVNGSSCTALAFVSPNGASPLSGEVTAKVWVETTQPSNFLKRHYEITPTTGAETATAKVTLYFTQQEFTDFNAVNSTKLPINAADTENYKAHLRIEKRAGKSDNGSGLPGSYDGTAVPINPLDPAVNGSITWNAAADRWEVSFEVTGFSGFFVKTTNDPLPLNLVSFTASKETGSNLLQWKTTSEVNTLNFEVQRSMDAKTFNKIGTVNANGSGNHQYRYNDVTTYYGNAYYRLKMIDRDGTFAYSKIISLTNEGNRAIVYPNPANASITISVDNSLLKSTANLYDITGRLLKNVVITNNQQQINVTSLVSGVYVLKFADGTAEQFVKE